MLQSGRSNLRVNALEKPKPNRSDSTGEPKKSAQIAGKSGRMAGWKVCEYRKFVQTGNFRCVRRIPAPFDCQVKLIPQSMGEQGVKI